MTCTSVDTPLMRIQSAGIIEMEIKLQAMKSIRLGASHMIDFYWKTVLKKYAKSV